MIAPVTATTTDLRSAAHEYLEIRRALGFLLSGHDRLLETFIASLPAGIHASVITIEQMVSWATRPVLAQPTRYAQRLCVVRGFARYLNAIDPSVIAPPTRLLSERRDYRIPHLYSAADIVSILDAASELQPAPWASTCRILFGLLAVTGMRIGEALALNCEDIDLHTGVLTIRRTKSRRYRQLPLRLSTTQELAAHIDLRRSLTSVPGAGAAGADAVFVSPAGRRVTYPAARVQFARLLTRTKIQSPIGSRGPTLHGLRHSFAVATLHEWSRDGADVTAMLPLLSAYLGHAHPASTYWYLHATPGMLAVAARQLEHNGGGRS